MKGYFTRFAHSFDVIQKVQPLLLLLIRLYWGWQFAVTGYGKLHHLSHVSEFFASLHLPFPSFTALFVACVEFLGGILFAAGVFTRPVALILFVNMTVAYWTADRAALLSILSAPEKFYGADPFPFWAAALLVLVIGSGSVDVDRGYKYLRASR